MFVARLIMTNTPPAVLTEVPMDSRAVIFADRDERSSPTIEPLDELLRMLGEKLIDVSLKLAAESAKATAAHRLTRVFAGHGVLLTRLPLGQACVRLRATSHRMVACRDLAAQLIGYAPAWALDEAIGIARQLLQEGLYVLDECRVPSVGSRLKKSRRARILGHVTHLLKREPD